MLDIKTLIDNHKTAIVIIGMLLLLITAYFWGRHSAAVAVQDSQPVQIPQEMLDNINVLQSKLDISEQNAKTLTTAIGKIQAGQTAPVANYYVTASTVEKAANIVQQQIKANDSTIPPVVLEKTDRTVVAPITKG